MEDDKYSIQRSPLSLPHPRSGRSPSRSTFPAKNAGWGTDVTSRERRPAEARRPASSAGLRSVLSAEPRDQSRLQTWSFGALSLLIGTLLLAFGLRLYRIGAQSLWNDEGTSVALAARDLAAITRGAANDIHPPLYYYLLHFWMALFGKSELAVRSLSALLGTLVVLLVFALGCFLAGPLHHDGRRTGLLAALFAALAPFQVYYSQEARMYILTAFLAAASVCAFLRLLSGWQDARRSDSLRPCMATLYAAATILLLYSHYFAAAVLVVENLAFLWWLVAGWEVRHRLRQDQNPGTRRWSLLLPWAALQAIVVGAYIPWLLLVREQLRVWPAVSQPLGLTSLLLDILRIFSLGLSVPAGLSPVLLGFAILLLLGMLMPRPSNSTPYAVCMLYLLVPIGIMYVLSLQRPMYNPKFLLLCSVPFCLFLAQGALYLWPRPANGGTEAGARNQAGRLGQSRVRSWLGRALVLAATIFVVLSSLYSLRAYYFNPRYARDDYRGIAQYIQAVEGEGDAVLINAPSQIETFAYYYKGALPLYPLPGQRPLDEAQTEADLQQVVQGRKRLFAVLWATDESDPGRFIEGWLDQHTYKALDSWYGNVRLVVYAIPEEFALNRIEHPLHVDLGGVVRLLGYNLPRTERGTEYMPSTAGGTVEVMPGDILQLTCIWEAIAPISERYKVFTHVLDAYGHLVGQRDAEPGGGAEITTIWKEGEQVVDNYGLPILPGAPPGDYVIEVGMYGLSDGRRLPMTKDGQATGDSVVLQSVRVLPALAPPSLSVLGMRRQLSIRFDNVTLLGYDLAKLGQEHEPDAPIHPGDILHLTLFWQAHQALGEDLAVVLRLQDGGGRIWLERRTQPTEGLYPTGQWRMNEIIRDQHNLFLPPDVPAGRSYRIFLSVERVSSGVQVGSTITLSSLAIQ
jgi:mannosyltransferase